MSDSGAAAGSDAPELKAGHAPAVKVGGMRVVQHKQRHDSTGEEPKKPAPSKEDAEEFGEDPKPEKKPASVVVSGAKLTEADAFPKEAVKAFHDKPQPTHDKNPGAHNKPNIIHQPRK